MRFMNSAIGMGGSVHQGDGEGPLSAKLAALWRPYIETCIEAFGAGRCMFESNFPPDAASCSYRTLWNAFKRITAQYSATERSELFSGTARRVFRLGAA